MIPWTTNLHTRHHVYISPPPRPQLWCPTEQLLNGCGRGAAAGRIAGRGYVHTLLRVVQSTDVEGLLIVTSSSWNGHLVVARGTFPWQHGAACITRGDAGNGSKGRLGRRQLQWLLWWRMHVRRRRGQRAGVLLLLLLLGMHRLLVIRQLRVRQWRLHLQHAGMLLLG